MPSLKSIDTRGGKKKARMEKKTTQQKRHQKQNLRLSVRLGGRRAQKSNKMEKQKKSIKHSVFFFASLSGCVM
jgi:hypothetical protein